MALSAANGSAPPSSTVQHKVIGDTRYCGEESWQVKGPGGTISVVKLSEGLADWTDWDGAAFIAGRSLGVFADGVAFTQVKSVFWTDNPLGDALREVSALFEYRPVALFENQAT